MDQNELNAVLEQAAERGARRALERIGLHDENAGKDINDLRTLIDSWREAKSTISKTVVQWATIGILGALTLGAYMQFTGRK